MPVPDYETLMLPTLRLFADGARSVAECLPKLIDQFDISEKEAQELLPSGRVTVLQSRTHWARTYLSKAGLLESPKRNQHRITERGRLLLTSEPERIDKTTLEQFESFSEWIARSRADASTSDRTGESDAAAIGAKSDESQTPEDTMESASAILNAALRDELLGILQSMNPVRFERLILDLLGAMGYGGGDLSNGRLTKASRDGGVDGVIDEDALGLDAVYVQAKCYGPNYNVGRPDLQKFVGSLTGEGASKGVFVTTSDFSRDAAEYVGKVQQRIVLIDGPRLASLMIQHGVGVRARATYTVRSVDEDYFAEP